MWRKIVEFQFFTLRPYLLYTHTGLYDTCSVLTQNTALTYLIPEAGCSASGDYWCPRQKKSPEYWLVSATDSEFVDLELVWDELGVSMVWDALSHGNLSKASANAWDIVGCMAKLAPRILPRIHN